MLTELAIIKQENIQTIVSAAPQSAVVFRISKQPKITRNIQA